MRYREGRGADQGQGCARSTGHRGKAGDDPVLRAQRLEVDRQILDVRHRPLPGRDGHRRHLVRRQKGRPLLMEPCGLDGTGEVRHALAIVGIHAPPRHAA